MINNQGTVYFRAQENISDDISLYVKPYHQDMRTYFWSPSAVYAPVMNDRNQVAFKWVGDDIAMASLPGSPTVMVDTPDDLDQVPKIGNMNNSGVIVFVGRENLKRGIYKCTAPLTLELIAEENGTFNDLYDPCINNNDEVAYLTDLAAGGDQIRIDQNVVVDTVQDDFSALGAPSINDSGRVAFWGMVAQTFITGIYFGAVGESPTTYADENDGIWPNQAYFPDINNLGQVAFMGSVGGVPSILIGPEPATDTVIKVGDNLDGSTVKSLSARQMNGHFFNDYGQVVFMAELENDDIGFYRADPEGLVIPGPVNPGIYNLLFNEAP